jgi:hypothetical protein
MGDFYNIPITIPCKISPFPERINIFTVYILQIMYNYIGSKCANRIDVKGYVWSKIYRLAGSRSHGGWRIGDSPGGCRGGTD